MVRNPSFPRTGEASVVHCFLTTTRHWVPAFAGTTEKHASREQRAETPQLVWRSADNFAKSLKFGEDRFGRCGPHEGLGMLVVVVDESFDLAFEISH